MFNKHYAFLILSLFTFERIAFSATGPQINSSDLQTFLKDQHLSDEMAILKTKPFITMSLGENCFPALHMEEHDLRIRAFPFDWNYTPADALYAVIENNFEGFLDPKNLVIHGDTVLHKRYNFRFMHDFNVSEFYDGPNGLTPKGTAGMENYKKIVASYHRRIARFYSVFHLGVPLYMFRRVITSAQAQKLFSLLKTKFPQSSFKLVCIEDEQWGPEKSWIVPEIINLTLQKASHVSQQIYYLKMSRCECNARMSGQQQNPVWTNLFFKAGLIKSLTPPYGPFKHENPT